MDEQFLRTRMILGADAVERLRCSHVIVFGLGGVGSYAAEALARAGVGELTLVDQDTLSVSNINRQLYALHSTVGMYKADVAAARCLDINPALRVHPVCATYDAAHREDFFTARYDYIVDAIDLVSCKLDLVEQARERGIPIISAMGTGNKLDPTLLTVTDLARTSGCPLARVMRRELRRRGIEHLQVVYSPEPPAEPEPLEEPSPGRRAVPASVSWVPSCAGLMMAGAAFRGLVELGMPPLPWVWGGGGVGFLRGGGRIWWEGVPLCTSFRQRKKGTKERRQKPDGFWTSSARPARFRSLGCVPHGWGILQGALNVVSSAVLRRCC